ncbi:hypothetical protein SeLEV6574_g06810 [Synchytrium endobioticum]|uniref:BZIP domain-containing protein n=1 Tax=Synchytrium endobioticum TaxID=286115 RepID=A0A507CMR7_9FUNG|nr:hypothetical protein SeLEV6574_g06810 [Synchytrium endobioticum]
MPNEPAVHPNDLAMDARHHSDDDMPVDPSLPEPAQPSPKKNKGGGRYDPSTRDERTQARILRNRAAANASRLKKKKVAEHLERANSLLRSENERLAQRVKDLEVHNSSLESKLNALTCQVNAILSSRNAGSASSTLPLGHPLVKIEDSTIPLPLPASILSTSPSLVPLTLSSVEHPTTPARNDCLPAAELNKGLGSIKYEVDPDDTSTITDSNIIGPDIKMEHNHTDAIDGYKTGTTTAPVQGKDSSDSTNANNTIASTPTSSVKTESQDEELWALIAGSAPSSTMPLSTNEDSSSSFLFPLDHVNVNGSLLLSIEANQDVLYGFGEADETFASQWTESQTIMTDTQFMDSIISF